MKKIILILSALFVVASVIIDGQAVKDSKAGGGCCMERRDLNTYNWRPNGMKFPRMPRREQWKDNDDLYRPTGYFWVESRLLNKATQPMEKPRIHEK
jgi:hypothetical protein